jgi:hypothetical protein
MRADRYSVRHRTAQVEKDPAHADRLSDLVSWATRTAGLPVERVFVSARDSWIDVVVLCPGTGCDPDIVLSAITRALDESLEFTGYVITANVSD